MSAFVAATVILSHGHLLRFANKTYLTTQPRPSRSARPISHRPLRGSFPVLLSQRQPNHFDNGDDADEVFDDLLNKYGKVVYKSSEQMPSSGETADDAESLSFAVSIAKVADDAKAADIRILFVKPLVYWTQYFIIVTAFSRPQIDAIMFRIKEIAEKQFQKTPPSGDAKPNSWTLLDFGDVVVHIFLPQMRAFYNLEEFYRDATLIETPFHGPPSL